MSIRDRYPLRIHCFARTELARNRVEGEDVVRVTNHPGVDGHPVWLLDGRHIASHTCRDGAGEIYTMRFDGTELRNITNHDSEDWQPEWARPTGGSAAVGANVMAATWGRLRVAFQRR